MTELVINGVIYHAQICENGVYRAPSNEAEDAICDLVREHMRHHATQFKGDIRISRDGLHHIDTYSHDFKLSPSIQEKHTVAKATELFAKIIGMPESPERPEAAERTPDASDRLEERVPTATELADRALAEAEDFPGFDGSTIADDDVAEPAAPAPIAAPAPAAPAAPAAAPRRPFTITLDARTQEAIKRLIRDPEAPANRELRAAVLSTRQADDTRGDEQYINLYCSQFLRDYANALEEQLVALRVAAAT